MGEFQMNVIRRRYFVKDGDFGGMQLDTDEVIVDVDDDGRVALSTDHRIGTRRPTGGNLCYAGWKRMTGVRLHPNKVYRVKLAVECLDEGRMLIPSEHEDLAPAEEVIAAEAKSNEGVEAYNKALREAKKALKGKDSD